MQRKQKISIIILHIVLILGACIMILPFFVDGTDIIKNRI